MDLGGDDIMTRGIGSHSPRKPISIKLKSTTAKSKPKGRKIVKNKKLGSKKDDGKEDEAMEEGMYSLLRIQCINVSLFVVVFF